PIVIILTPVSFGRFAQIGGEASCPLPVLYIRGGTNPHRGRRHVMIDQLTEALGEKVTTNAAVREQHGRDENYPVVTPPEAVVFAETEDDVLRTLDHARQNGL